MVDLTDYPPPTHTNTIVQAERNSPILGREADKHTHSAVSQPYTHAPVRSGPKSTYSRASIDEVIKHSHRTIQQSNQTVNRIRGEYLARQESETHRQQGITSRKDPRNSAREGDGRVVETDPAWDSHVSSVHYGTRTKRVQTPQSREIATRTGTLEFQDLHNQQHQPANTQQLQRERPKQHLGETPHTMAYGRDRSAQTQRNQQELRKTHTAGEPTGQAKHTQSAYSSRDITHRQMDQRAHKPLNDATSYASAQNLFDSRANPKKEGSLSRAFSYSAGLASASRPSESAHHQRKNSGMITGSSQQSSRNISDYIDVEETEVQCRTQPSQRNATKTIVSTNAPSRNRSQRQSSRATTGQMNTSREKQPVRPTVSSTTSSPEMIDLITDDEAEDELRRLQSEALYGTPTKTQVKPNQAHIVDVYAELSRHGTDRDARGEDFDLLNQSVHNISLLDTNPYFEKLPIPREAFDRVKRVWRRTCYKDSDVVASGLQCSVTQRDLCRLKGLEWLNDSLVNMYMAMINDRSVRPGSRFPRVHCFNSYFLPKLRHDGYEKMQRWTKKVDLFSMDYVIVPVHRGNHWTTAIINFADKRFEYYDSMHGGGQDVQDLLRLYIKHECMAKKGRAFPLDDWVDFTPRNLTPQQGNGSDCGVFACQFSEYRSRGSLGVLPHGDLFDFGQEEMPYFRRRMAHEILSKRLMIQ